MKDTDTDKIYKHIHHTHHKPTLFGRRSFLKARHRSFRSSLFFIPTGLFQAIVAKILTLKFGMDHFKVFRIFLILADVFPVRSKQHCWFWTNFGQI